MSVVIFVSILFSLCLIWFLTKEKKILVLGEERTADILAPIVRTKYINGHLFFYKNCYNSKEELSHSYITDIENLQHILNKNDVLEIICRELQKNDIEVTKAQEDVDYQHSSHYWKFFLVLENSIKIDLILDKTPNFMVHVARINKSKTTIYDAVYIGEIKETIFYIKNKILKAN